MDHADEAVDEEEQHGDDEVVVIGHDVVDPKEGEKEVQVMGGKEEVIGAAADGRERGEQHDQAHDPRHQSSYYGATLTFCVPFQNLVKKIRSWVIPNST